MRTFVLVLSAASFLFTGCVLVHDHGRHYGTHRSELSSREPERQCHPSQYWDGERCVHKGRGHGARKHDD